MVRVDLCNMSVASVRAMAELLEMTPGECYLRFSSARSRTSPTSSSSTEAILRSA